MRRVPLLVLAALLLPAAAHAGNPVLDAAKRSARATSSTMEIRTTTTVPGAGTVVATGSGAQSGRNVRLTIHSHLGGASVRIDVVGLVDRGHFLMYLRSPLFRAQLPPGKTWVRFDLHEQGAKLGIDVSSLLGSSQALAPLWHGLVSTRRVGAEVVRGRGTTRYRATVDYDRAGAALPAFGKQLAAIERVTGVDVDRLEAEVWIGGGYVRRLRTTTPTVVQGVRARSVQTITYLGYGVPVRIAAPPAAQVFDLPG